MRYNRKYYLHRRVRSAGFGLTSSKESKTISVKPDQIHQAHENKYVKELRDTHSYAVQYINPIMTL